jgi:tetratricopeptide (TPR) repeat protein
MKDGNGEEAVYWSKKLLEIAKTRSGTSNHDFTGYALELNGEYDKALDVFENHISNKRCEFNIDRVKYKLGRKEEAFQGYCEYADHCLIQDQERLNDQRLEQRILALGKIRYPITMERDGLFMRLSPFLDYKDFLDFMEEEYQKLGEPQEYAAAMELFRAIDMEIDETHLPRSGASDQLDEMRAKILAERKEKGVKW